MFKEYRVTGLDADGYELAASLECSLKDAKQRAKYLVSAEYAKRSGIGDIHKAEVRSTDKPLEVLFDAFPAY